MKARAKSMKKNLTWSWQEKAKYNTTLIKNLLNSDKPKFLHEKYLDQN